MHGVYLFRNRDTVTMNTVEQLCCGGMSYFNNQSQSNNYAKQILSIHLNDRLGERKIL